MPSGRWCRPVLFLLQLAYLYETSFACTTYTQNDVIVVAFLSVYDESACSRLRLRSLQQMAILDKTAAEINAVEAVNEGLKLRLQVVDTCNPSERNMDAALRSLRAQLACPDPPLLLGFIGPENRWKAIQRATSDFQRTQLLPFKPETKQIALPDSLLLHVGNDRLPLRSQIFLATLNQLKWKSIFIVVGGNTDKKQVLDHVFNRIEQVCVTGLVELPKGSAGLDSFYSFIRKEYLETNSDGLVLFVDDPDDFRPLLREMTTASSEETTNPSVILYLCNVGLKSWELPRNYTMLILQETSDFGGKFSLTSFQNRTLWDQYYTENEIDFKRDAFGELLDASLAPYEYALRIYWNAAKYAKKIKCDLGTNPRSLGSCFDLANTSPLEWKSFINKASYHDSDSLRKISLEMNLPVTVRMYFVNSVINFPQQVGRMNENGIMDLKMSLQSVIPSKAVQSGLRKCIPPTHQRNIFFSPVPIDHETNWLAAISKKLKNWLQFNGLISAETTEVIHTILVWTIAVLAFFLCFTFLTKCVYRVFRVQTVEEQEASLRRKQGRRVVI